MPDDFSLSPPPERPAFRNGGRRPGAGRPRGTINRLRDKLSERSWKAGAREHPEILEGILKRAKKLADPHWTPNKIDAQLAVWVAEHYWPVPRSAPIQIDLRNGASMQDALTAGDLTPSDYGALIRANSQRMDVGGPIIDTGHSDARQQLADRLARAIEDRDRRNGFHNPSSEEQSASPHGDDSPGSPGSPGEPAAAEDDLTPEEVERIVRETVAERLGQR